MPIYEYACTACGHRADILHGINESGPNFCPECGAEGSMRKGFAPPAIVFKGSGWAKKDRASGSRTKAAAKSGESGADGKTTDSTPKTESASGSSTGASTASTSSSGAD